MGPVTLLFLWGGGCSGVISDIFHRKLIFCVGRFADIPRAHHFCTFDLIEFSSSFENGWNWLPGGIWSFAWRRTTGLGESWQKIDPNLFWVIIFGWNWTRLEDEHHLPHTHTHQFLVSMLIEDFKLQLNRLNSIVLHPAPPQKKNEHSLNLQIDGLL